MSEADRIRYAFLGVAAHSHAPPIPLHPHPRRIGRWALALASVAFVTLAVMAHRTPYFDADLRITRTVQELTEPWLIAPLDALSAIGFPPVVDLVYGAIAIAIYVAGRRRAALGAGFAAGSGALLNFTVKALVDRPRPPASLVHVQHAIASSTFPAGHVLNATAFFGFLLYLAAARMPHSWRRTTLLVLLAATIAGMGLARIYSGEHWPSDVLGGYLLGWIACYATIAFHRWLESRDPPPLHRHRSVVPFASHRSGSRF